MVIIPQPQVSYNHVNLFPTPGDIVLHVYMKDLLLEVGR